MISELGLKILRDEAADDNQMGKLCPLKPELLLELISLAEKSFQLDREADWLAKNLEYACYNKEDGSGCFTCEQLCPELVNEHKMKNRDGYKTCRGATLYGWREAARKAVETSHEN